ncbi:MAG: LPS export ABC transporter permease LptG [Gammaproteobacteria bacterium]
MKAVINRYIIFSVIKATLFVALVMVGVDVFVQFVNEMRYIGRGDYSLLEAFIYVPMTLPKDIYQFFPMIGLVGALVGLGLMATNSELVAMRAASFSIMKITQAVLIAAIILSLVMALIGETVAPYLQKQADAIKENAIYSADAVSTHQGLWLKMKGDYVHVESVESQKKLAGVTRYHFNNDRSLHHVAFAKEVNFNGRHWVAKDIDASVIHNQRVTLTHEDVEVWREMKLNPKILLLKVDEPEDMSVVQLGRMIHFRHKVGMQADDYELAFWQRIFQPLSSLVMILLAIPFVFGSLRTGTMGLRIMIGLILGLSFYLLNEFSMDFSMVYHIPPSICALLPILLFGSVGMVLMLRVK